MEKEKLIITDPGKFEGSPRYAPYFWDGFCDGGADEEVWEGDTPISVFRLNDDDKGKYPELADCQYVILWEDSQGFVYADAMTESEYQEFVGSLED